MLHIDTTGKVHDDMDGAALHLLPDGCVPISIEEYNLLQAEKRALLPYTDLRTGAYPSIVDQLDMQFKDAVNGTTTWADSIAAVKSMYPKPVA